MSASLHRLAEAAVQAVSAAAAEPPALHLFALFHLNLAFSSIEENERAAVIELCYWPLLSLATTQGPVGIEATGYTLEEIEKHDAAWIRRFRDLIAEGKAELIGSGYAQLIGPLVPARVVEKNLAIGHETYERLLGVRPTLALVNEQAYAGGLVGLYRDAGYEALLMDWDNAGAQHPEWDAETRYQPQTAVGSDGRTIGILWTNTVAFQKLQRYAHGDIALDGYLDFVASRRGTNTRALCLYASDGEIFDFRPGRYRTEETLSNTEWARLGAAFSALSTVDGMTLMRPSDAFRSIPSEGRSLRLETAVCPVPVKKQRKYNLTRWAVTGRDDIGINAACQRVYAELAHTDADDADWKALCRLWASDYRTHITQSRWNAYCAELSAVEKRLGTAQAPQVFLPKGRPVEQRFIDVSTTRISGRLDRRRGLAVQELAFDRDVPVVGGLPHGHFDDIALQADWYTGDCVYEQPGEPKITDLEWAETTIAQSGQDVLVAGRIVTPLGHVKKVMRFHDREPRVDFDITFQWNDWGKGSLRLGHVTLLPEAFDWQKLTLATHNGGFAPETFALNGQTVDHGAPVSFLVSASCGFGMTEGWAELSDGKRSVRVEVDRQTAPLLGLLTHRQVGGSLFCQLALSMLELDDTRRPTPYLKVARRARFSLIGNNQNTRSTTESDTW
jgi:hypothetical protein